MNIFNKILLRFALLPESLYRSIGVDTKHLELILSIKLLMDDRRPNTFHQTRQKKSEKSISGATLGTMLLSAFLGFLFLFSFKISNVMVTQLTFYFSMYVFMLASTLISDFTSVLIDIRDNYIILPKPVTDKTFVLSRLLHILIHVTKIIVPMGLPGVVYMGILNGVWAAVVFFLMIISATIFTVFLINIIYLIILKFTSPGKFQNIISYVQIALTILIYGSFQVMPRLIDKIDLGSYVISPDFGVWLLPPYWFALSCKFFTTFSLQPSLVTGALLSILIPPLSLWMVIKYFAPSFNQKLSLITGATEESASQKKSDINRHVSKLTLGERAAKIFSRNGEEQMGFLLTWKLTSRLRDFKMKVYPSIGYFLVFFIVIFIKNTGFSFHEIIKQPDDKRSVVLFTMYTFCLLLFIALGQIQFSDKFKSAWFYFTAPIEKPGLIFSGSVKAMIIKFYLPTVFILSIIEILLLGISLLPNMLLGLSNVVLGSLILSLFTLRNFPFSAMQQTNQKAGAIFRSIISMMMIFVLAFLQYLIFNIQIVVVISIALSVLANWLLLDYIQNKSWAEVLDSYNE